MQKGTNRKNKATIFQIVQHLRPGGIEVLALNILEKLRDHSNLMVISLEGTKDEALQSWPVLQDYRDQLIFLNKKPGWSVATLLRLVTLFKQQRPDAVHTHHIGPMLYGGLAARITGVQTLLHTEHDGWHLTVNGTLQRKLIRLLKPAVIPVAYQVAGCLAKFCGAKATRIIHNGVDCDRFKPGDKQAAREHFSLPAKPVLIGTAGRMESVKGHRFLIEAMNGLPEHVHLVLAGDGSLRRELEDLSAECALSHRIHFLGRIDDMPGFYQALDLFCLPSLNEGFPLSPLEAQACAVPCVLTNVGGSAETLCPHSGRLAKAGDALDLSERLQDALAQKKSGTARDFILQHFELHKTLEAYCSLYGSGMPLANHS
ncbi:glycosyltransferase [Kiloniella sp. b19]|uniref:glycosyltransferase n=1 Tax=Kiloniella sp. GXU_MW_B19 TaxID=3141326 RepID=UPI0031D9037B